MATIEKFEDLEVWQLSRCLCQHIEDIISSEKLNRRYAIKDQIERSSGSIMDNIAEGFGRSGSLEFRNFLGYAKGSCSELKSQIYRLYDKHLILEEDYEDLSAQCDHINAKLGSFIKYLSATKYRGTKFKS
ncbi:four helix bundle protein [Leeuwenhoekiella palythoae]|uniref:four helix bundle protein n=1 Tax=Leeuwenhoekiella palythoae TaxID=573501 RepID=UPI0035120B42